MKEYFKLSIRERADLTEEELEEYIKAETVLAGHLLPIPPNIIEVPEKPEELPVPTRTIFIVKVLDDGYERQKYSVAFETLEQADAFIKLNPMYYSERYQRNAEIEEYNQFIVTRVNVVSKDGEQVEEANEALTKPYNDALRHNRRETERFEEQTRKIQEPRRKVMDNWRAIHKVRTEMENVITTLHGFIEVTGDTNIAIKCMLKTGDVQLIYDALNEIEHGLVWDELLTFDNICLVNDNNPYRNL